MYNLKLFTMRKIILLLIVGFAVSFVGCNKLGTDPATNSRFTADTDLTALQQLLTVQNTPLEWTNVANSTKSTQTIGLTLNWTFDSPKKANGTSGVNGDPLSASAVEEDGNFVYVGFHDYDSEIYGAIIALKKDGSLVAASIHSDLIDVNDLEIGTDPTTLYVAGESNARGAEALKVSINTTSGVLGLDQSLGMPIFGSSGNSVTVVNNTDLLVSVGGRNQARDGVGGLMVIDLVGNNDPYSLYDSKEDVKQFDADGVNGIWIRQGATNTTVFMYIFNNLTNDYSVVGGSPFALGTAGIPASVTNLGKNAIDVAGNYAYMALGESGVYRVDLTSATPGSTSARFNLHEYFLANNIGNQWTGGYANGIKTDGTYVYVAYGADGLVVLNMDLTFVAQWNGDDPVSGATADNNGSCNYVDIGNESVYTSGGTGVVLYVAFGVGGLRKITMDGI